MKQDYLSYLMGAAETNVEDLHLLDIEVVGLSETGSFKLVVPADKLEAYKELVRENILAGFWNEMIGTEEILFLFKHLDGHLEELVHSAENQKYIAELCAQFSGDPLEKTTDLLNYLAANDFYTDRINQYYHHAL